jgi:uncharacterized membrane protein
MNLFTGMTDREILSVALTFVLFNVYVVLEVVALAAFHVTSRPRRGRVRTAALFHALAALLFMVCFVTLVWAAPAQKAFIDPNNGEQLFAGERFTKVIIGLVIAALGVATMIVGVVVGARQKRRIAEEAMLEEWQQTAPVAPSLREGPATRR